MTHTYQITGMTCNGCLNKVTNALEQLADVQDVQINLENGKASINMKKHVDTATLQNALKSKGAYTITEIKEAEKASSASSTPESPKTDYKQLYPLFLVFGYLIGGVLLSQIIAGSWNSMKAMQYFMGGFFLIFSFFKLLDLKGFAYSFSTYDPIAGRWLGYGFLYPFIELSLGVAYLLGTNLLLTNAITLGIVLIGTIGVAKTLLNKRKIQCACLGTVFNLPMTKVTLTENSIMIVMASIMLASII